MVKGLLEAAVQLERRTFKEETLIELQTERSVVAKKQGIYRERNSRDLIYMEVCKGFYEEQRFEPRPRGMMGIKKRRGRRTSWTLKTI